MPCSSHSFDFVTRTKYEPPYYVNLLSLQLRTSEQFPHSSCSLTFTYFISFQTDFKYRIFNAYSNCSKKQTSDVKVSWTLGIHFKKLHEKRLKTSVKNSPFIRESGHLVHTLAQAVSVFLPYFS